VTVTRTLGEHARSELQDQNLWPAWHSGLRNAHFGIFWEQISRKKAFNLLSKEKWIQMECYMCNSPSARSTASIITPSFRSINTQCTPKPFPPQLHHTLANKSSNAELTSLRRFQAALSPSTRGIARLPPCLPPSALPPGAQDAALALAPLVEGKRFICTECGKCCQGAGEVWVNAAEADALASLLKLQSAHFMRKYTKSYSKRPGWYLLQRKQGSGDCVFLEGGTKCAVYGARPLQCSTYPWWPELMGDAAWRGEADAVCEGISHESAVEVDAGSAAVQLQKASEHFAEYEAARATRKQRR